MQDLNVIHIRNTGFDIFFISRTYCVILLSLLYVLGECNSTVNLNCCNDHVISKIHPSRINICLFPVIGRNAKATLGHRAAYSVEYPALGHLLLGLHCYFRSLVGAVG